MKRINPKSHDSLFKWLITAFMREFFAHYFPTLTVGAYSFLDKEFLSRYEALKESLKGDLFLLMEVEIDGAFQEVAIQIEHQSEKLVLEIYRATAQLKEQLTADQLLLITQWVDF